ncbi:hypothetical protein EPO05_02495 [Patescibacteria group bacterium]|nr:MAG: hypothetical protein EPO05_02495 [Patescibacteria group bacterium]
MKKVICCTLFVAAIVASVFVGGGTLNTLADAQPQHIRYRSGLTGEQVKYDIHPLTLQRLWEKTPWAFFLCPFLVLGASRPVKESWDQITTKILVRTLAR